MPRRECLRSALNCCRAAPGACAVTTAVPTLVAITRAAIQRATSTPAAAAFATTELAATEHAAASIATTTSLADTALADTVPPAIAASLASTTDLIGAAIATARAVTRRTPSAALTAVAAAFALVPITAAIVSSLVIADGGVRL